MKKSEWGPLYWKTLHCMVIHINNDMFNSEKKKIWDIINKIISNLPCPYCKQHASSMIKKISYINIKCKNDLIKIIYSMHEEVNKRLKKKGISYEEHIDYYKKMNIKDIFTEFLKKNLNDRAVPKLMMFAVQKKMFLNELNIYLGKNLHKYL